MRAFVLFSLACVLAAACGDNDSPAGDGGPGDGGSDRTIEIDGLDGPVQAYFDEGGVLHLRCQSDADCFAAQGYFHASHRFFQMDLRRRVAQGQLSEMVGALAVDTDYSYRRLLSTRDGGFIGDQLWEGASPDTRAAIEAYTRGVNAWLDDMRAKEPHTRVALEYGYPVIQERFDDWEPIDTVASFLPVIAGLTDHSGHDIASGEAFAALGATAAIDLFGLLPASDSAILPAEGGGGAARARPAALRRTHERLSRHRALLSRALRAVGGPPPAAGEMGSNNWIVGPDKAGGAALLANDPHLPLSNPAIWYLVNMDSKSAGGTLHVAGASYPGMPGVLFGHNEDIAWGVTTTYFDQSDVYVETLSADGTAVVTADGEVPINVVEHQFELPGDDEPLVRTVEIVPHHGPILSRDAEAGTALSLRWAAQDADTDLNFVVAMARAGSVAEAREAISQVTSVGQNFVVVDRTGSLGWFPYNRVPRRPWWSTTPSWLPLPGDGSAEWGEYIPYEELPQAVDPAAGFLATANNDMTGALADGDPSGDSEAMQSHVAMGFRHERIAQRLAARDDHDLASMQDIQADVHSLVGERVVPEILEAAAAATLSPRAQKAADALTAWDFSCPTGLQGTAPDSEPADGDAAAASIGCTVFHLTWGHLMEMTFADEIEAAGLDLRPRSDALVLALARPNELGGSYWDNVESPVNETRDGIVAMALDATGAWLEEELGADPDGWRWGRVHTLTLRADLFDAFGVRDFNNGAYANDGGLATVDVAGPRDPAGGDLSHAHGASMRLACRADSGGVACTYELPGGQRHFLTDEPHYDDLLPRYLENQPTPLLFGIDEAEAAATETVQVVPAGSE